MTTVSIAIDCHQFLKVGTKLQAWPFEARLSMHLEVWRCAFLHIPVSCLLLEHEITRYPAYSMYIRKERISSS